MGEWSERRQIEQGDCLKGPIDEMFPTKIHLNIKDKDLERLKEIKNSLSPSEREYCQEVSGHILTMLSIKVDYQMLKALIFFWDPYYRCFTMGDRDLLPTIEEYTGMLWPKSPSPKAVYIPELRTDPDRSLANLLDMRMADVKNMLKKGPLTLDMLIGHMGKCTKPERMNSKMNAFLLAVYGTVVFPTAVGKIDSNVINFCNRMIEQHLNPVPVILAETFAALNYCRRNGKGRLCCAPMLHTWTLAHLAESGEKFANFNDWRREPLHEAAAMPQKERGMWEWMSNFQQLTENDISPRAKWVSGDAYLHQCGDHPWVPLLGHSNLISYAPSLGMRQTGAIQYIPCTNGLEEVEYKYTDSKAADMIAQARADWRTLTYVKKKGRLYGKSERYQAWHMGRHKALFIPEIPSTVKRPPSEAVENEVESPQVFEEEPSPLQQALERAAMFEEECDRMRARVREAEVSNAQHQQTEDLLQEKLKKMNNRREYVLKKSERLQTMYENRTREVGRLKKRDTQWQSLLEEERRQHQEEAKKRVFYQRESEEFKKQQEECVAMAVEREAEIEEMIKEKEDQTAFFNKECQLWQRDFRMIQKHRDECLGVIDEQKAKYQAACEDSRQFCRDLKREFQPMIDDVERAYKGVSRALQSMGPDLRNPEVLRPDLEEVRDNLAPYLFGRIAPRMLNNEENNRRKGKQRIEEYDE